MAQYRDSRGYRRNNERSGERTGDVVFKDGQPVTYSSRQERGGRRPERSENGYRGKSYDKPHERDGKPYDGKPYDGKPHNGKQYADKPYYKRNGDDAKPYGKKDYDVRPNYKKNEAEGENKPYYKKRDNAEGRFDAAKKEESAFKAKDKRAENARDDVAEADELPYIIMGRNAVREAVRSGRSIDRILVTKDGDGFLREIINLARDNNIRVDQVPKEKLDELCMPFGHGQKSGNHQGIVAKVPGVDYCEISDILDYAKEKGEKPFIIMLDGIEDPHNLGSIIRSAVCAGAHGVIIPRRRAVGVTAAASKASAGAIEYAHVARVANLTNAIARLKDEGLWIAGADMSGKPMASSRMEGALALVIGSEGEGISRLVKEKCDFLVSIPMAGPIDSLNAAVAAAILMFEKRRQDDIRQNTIRKDS